MSTLRRLALLAGALSLVASCAPTWTSVASATSTTTTTTPATDSPAPVAARTLGGVVVSGFSEKGDSIDNGVSTVVTSRWAKVSASSTGVYLSYRRAKSFGTYSFAPVAGQTLAVGEYDNAQRAAYRSAGFPGIEITGPGRPTGCTRLTGNFHVWDVAANAAGVLTRLDLTYVEHCGAGRPSNYGEVLINDAPRVGALFASATRITFPDQTPTLPYVLTNPTSHAQAVSLWQSATTLSHFILTAARPSCTTSVPARSACTYLFRLVPPRPGTYFATVLAVSNGSTVRLPLSGPAGGA